MNITEAGAYQGSFDAVANGTASDAQCIEVRAVTKALRAYLQEAELRAKAIPQRRADFTAILSDSAKATLATALPVDTKTAPRLVIDETTGEVGPPALAKPVTIEATPVAIK